MKVKNSIMYGSLQRLYKAVHTVLSTFAVDVRRDVVDRNTH